MSIELSNGVILPDIPEYDHDMYPYAIVCYLSSGVYQYEYSDYPFIIITNDVYKASVGRDQYCGHDYIRPNYRNFNGSSFQIKSNAETWEQGYLNDVCDYLSGSGSITNNGSILLYANHDVFKATAWDISTYTATLGDEVYFANSLGTSTTEEKKFLGIAGTERLISNIRSEINIAEQNAKDFASNLFTGNSSLPSGGTAGQVLTMGEDGKAVWADAPTGGGSIPSAEGVEF